MFLRTGRISRHCWACKPRVNGCRLVVAFTSTLKNFWSPSSFFISFSSFGTLYCTVQYSSSAWTTRWQFGAASIKGCSVEILLAILEALFDLAHSCQLCLMVQYLPDRQILWVDAPSQYDKLSVEWHCRRQKFCFLTSLFGHLEINLFPAPNSQLLPLFLN